MDLKALTYFVSVYEKGSISAAAKACFIAQPSISSAIHQLETTLNGPLFIRHARGVYPTEAGEQLYPLAKQLLGKAEAIRNVFSEREKTTQFKLGLIRALGVKRMSLILKDFTSALESVELTLVEPDDDCDARLITKQYLHPSESFVPMWLDHYALALPQGHPLSFKTEIELSDFNQLPFIQRTPCEAWKQLVTVLNENNIEMVTRAKIQTLEYALGLVGAGVGCALLPDLPQVTDDQSVVLRPIKNLDLTRTIGLAYQQKSSTIQLLESICKAQSSAK